MAKSQETTDFLVDIFGSKLILKHIWNDNYGYLTIQNFVEEA